jgi:RNA polymerase sigma-70 factor (ECF subfamily)
MSNRMEQRVRTELGQARTRDLMIRTVRRVVRDHDSEDVAHDAVVQALAASSRFREEAQVGTWLHRIAVNAALMSHRYDSRASRRLERAQQEVTDGRWLGKSEGEKTAAAVLEAFEDQRRLREAVNSLPAPYREVIERCVYREEGPGQVAGELGITASAVRTRVSRAQERLRKLITEG